MKVTVINSYLNVLEVAESFWNEWGISNPYKHLHCDDVGICLVTKSFNTIIKKTTLITKFAFLFILSYIGKN